MLSALAIERYPRGRAQRRGRARRIGRHHHDQRPWSRSSRSIPLRERLFGIREIDARGKDMAALLIPARLSRGVLPRSSALSCRTGDGLIGSRYRSTGRRPADNTEFPVEIATYSGAGRDENSLITGFVRDVTIEQQAEQALLASHDDLERKVEERTEENARVIRELEVARP